MYANENGTFVASVSGGVQPFHFQWWYKYSSSYSAPSSLRSVRPNVAPINTWNTLSSDSPTLTNYSTQDIEYKCVVTDATNASLTSNIISVSIIPSLSIRKSDINSLSVEKIVTDKADDYSLGSYPNPFNPTSEIRYSLPKDGFVTLKVYDVLGKEVATLVNEHKQAGYYIVTFNAGNLPSGLYLYSIQANGFNQTKKLILAK